MAVVRSNLRLYMRILPRGNSTMFDFVEVPCEFENSEIRFCENYSLLFIIIELFIRVLTLRSLRSRASGVRRTALRWCFSPSAARRPAWEAPGWLAAVNARGLAKKNTKKATTSKVWQTFTERKLREA